MVLCSSRIFHNDVNEKRIVQCKSAWHIENTLESACFTTTGYFTNNWWIFTLSLKLPIITNDRVITNNYSINETACLCTRRQSNSLIMNIEYILPQEKPNPQTPTTKKLSAFHTMAFVYCIQTGYHSNNINTTLQPSQSSLVVIIILACNLQKSNNLAATQSHSIVLLVCFPSSSFELLTQYPSFTDDHEISINQRLIDCIITDSLWRSICPWPSLCSRTFSF